MREGIHGNFHIHCIACLLPLIGKENLSVQNFPLSPKTKWITLENLMQLNVLLEHEQEKKVKVINKCV